MRPFLIAVAAGSALGAATRYGASALLLALLGPGLGWGTLVANGLGSFLIGLYSGLAAAGGRISSQCWRGFVTTGFCGGFTTFSVFSTEAVLLAADHPGHAMLLVIGSTALWLLAVSSGAWAGTRFAGRD